MERLNSTDFLEQVLASVPAEELPATLRIQLLQAVRLAPGARVRELESAYAEAALKRAHAGGRS